MKARVLGAVAALLFPAVALAQSPKGATYITAEQVKQVNAHGRPVYAGRADS